MDEFLQNLQYSDFGIWVAGAPTVFAYPAILTLHTVGLAIVVGPLMLGSRSCFHRIRSAAMRRARPGVAVTRRAPLSVLAAQPARRPSAASESGRPPQAGPAAYCRILQDMDQVPRVA